MGVRFPSKMSDYQRLVRELEVSGDTYRYFSLPSLEDERVDKLPFSIRVLLESAVRNCDNFTVLPRDVERILDWQTNQHQSVEVAFKPARVLMQDFTGVPAVVDIAAMREQIKVLGGDPKSINPEVPVDLVIDHSVQVDKFNSPDALEFNLTKEFERNKERFQFLKWGAKAFNGLTIVPPGAGIVHQVNLEYLARGVFAQDGVLYPDSLVGTDSHTPMINGLGIVGWGVGGIEAEAVMLGQPISMVLPQVIGYKLVGELPPQATATDLVLMITKNLRAKGVVGKFVEFYGPGVASLSLADRATISNMSPEYGATIGFFPADEKALGYLRLTGRDEKRVAYIEAYLKAQNMFRNYNDESSDPVYTDTLELDLSTVVPCLSGPKRPHDYVALSQMKEDFGNCLKNPVGFKGFNIAEDQLNKQVEVEYEGEKTNLSHGSVVIAAITSCTNTSNPSVMISAGLLARNAVKRGLKVKKFVKTSLAPGSNVVTQYLEKSDLLPYMKQLGFDIVCYGVLSGNRNFEGRIHPHVRANYLASPPLVVSYALAGTTLINFDEQPLGVDSDNKPVFLKEIWPSSEEIAETIQKNVLREFFTEVYKSVTEGTDGWNSLNAPDDALYPWDEESTYIHHPPFFQTMEKEVEPITTVTNARCLLNLGDSITTDHISPAGSISIRSPAARYLQERGVERKDFNSYGSRRGNDQVMARGTFANTRLVNKFIGKAAPKTVHHPSGEVLDVFDAADKYIQEGTPLIILAGANYGSGSSRDWAAKGVWMQNVKAVIAVSYERIHRSNLVLFGVMPLEFKEGDSADSLGLTGKETFSIELDSNITPGMDVTVNVQGGAIDKFVVKLRVDTVSEVAYYNNGGVLNYVIRNRVNA